MPLDVGKHKTAVYAAGGGLALYLAYKWYENSNANNAQAASTQTGASTPDTSSSDYAALAGQEQSDVAALQAQNQQLASSEQSDVQNLSGSLTQLTGQEFSDTQALTAAQQQNATTLNGLQSLLASLGNTVTGLTSTVSNISVPAVASGHTAVSRISANVKYLAPGALNPSYALKPPPGAPSSARWAGSSKPSGSWRGIGGGWYVPVKK